MHLTNEPTILLVEDEAILAMAESSVIKNFGFKVVIAVNGEEAVQKACNDRYIQLILMDIDLGRGIDGTEASRRILEKRDIPIIFLTSHSEREMVERVKEITRYGYILKNSGNFVLQSSIEMAFELFSSNQLIKESEKKHRLLYETMAQGVVYQDERGEIIEANPAAERILGLSRDQMTGKSSMDPDWRAIREDGCDFPGSEHPSMIALETGKEITNTVMGVYNPRNNEHRWIYVNAIPEFRDGEHKPCRVYATFEDITRLKRVEEELKETRDLFMSIFHKSPLPSAVIRLDDMTFTDINRQAEIFLGFSRDELIGRQSAMFDLSFYPEERDNLIKALQNKRHIENFEFSIKLRTGEKREVLFFADTIEMKDGRYCIVKLIDETERKKEEAHRRKLYDILNSSLNEVYLFDAETLKFEFVSDGAVRNLQYPLESLKMMTPLAIKPEMTFEKFNAITKPLREHVMNMVEFETVHRRSDGTQYPVEVHLQLFEYEERRYYLAVILDITDRNLTRNELRIKTQELETANEELNATVEELEASNEEMQATMEELEAANEELIRSQDDLTKSETRYRKLFEENPNPMWAYDLETLRFLAVNNAAVAHYGYSRDEFMNMTIADIRPNDDVPQLLENVKRVTEGIDHAGTWRHIKKSGEIIIVEITSHTTRWMDRSAEIIVALDVTEKTAAQEALRESEERFRTLFNEAPEGIFIQTGGNFSFINDTALRIWGAKNREDLIGRQVAPHFHPDCRDNVIERIRTLNYDRKIVPLVEETILKFDGSTAPVEVTASPFTYRNENGAVVYLRDISEKKKTAAAYAEMEERFRLAFENANIGACLVDLSGRLFKVNRKMSEIFGYSKEELETMNVNQITHPDDRNVSPRFIEQAKEGALTSGLFEKKYHHKNGQIVYGLVSSTMVRGAEGEPLYFISHVQDITERKKIETELGRSIEERDQLLLELQHRVKNSLTIIACIVSLEIDRLKETSLKNALSGIKDRVDSILALYAFLHQTGSTASVSLDGYLAMIVQSLKNSYFTGDNSITIEENYESLTIESKMAAPFGLMVNELLTNSLKHAFKGRERGRILVELRNNESSIMLTISDDGIGMSNEFNLDDSSGFGMMIIRMLSKQLGGTIIHDQKPYNRFTLTVPM